MIPRTGNPLNPEFDPTTNSINPIFSNHSAESSDQLTIEAAPLPRSSGIKDQPTVTDEVKTEVNTILSQMITRKPGIPIENVQGTFVQGLNNKIIKLNEEP